MGNNNKTGTKDRRWFLSLFAPADKKAEKDGMIKMLTADGKLVEVDKAIFEKASKKQKSSNQEVYEWMQNPSKKH